MISQLNENRPIKRLHCFVNEEWNTRWKGEGKGGMRNKSGGCSDPSLRSTDGEPKMKWILLGQHSIKGQTRAVNNRGGCRFQCFPIRRMNEWNMMATFSAFFNGRHAWNWIVYQFISDFIRFSIFSICLEMNELFFYFQNDCTLFVFEIFRI